MKFNSKGFLLRKRNQKVEDIDATIGTNGRLRRALALSVLQKHVSSAIWVFIIFVVILSISGTGTGLVIFNVKIPPIAPLVLNTVTTVAVLMITRLFDNAALILNYYFNLKDETAQKTPQQIKEDFDKLHQTLHGDSSPKSNDIKTK